jgi:hypothetical protein
MVNHVGKTNVILNKNLGQTTQFTSSDDVMLIAGDLNTGALIFDPDGTVGVVTTFMSGNDFMVTTHALSIDIQAILSLEY